MTEVSRGNVFASWPAMLLLLAVVGGVLQDDVPLETRRGTEEGSVGELKLQPGSLPSRLWADPLGVRNELRLDLKSKPNTNLLFNEVKAFIERIKGSRDRAGNEVLILPVFTNSKLYKESVERRRRVRYAVVSALSRLGFEPEISDVVRYMWFEMKGGVSVYERMKELFALSIDFLFGETQVYERIVRLACSKPGEKGRRGYLTFESYFRRPILVNPIDKKDKGMLKRLPRAVFVMWIPEELFGNTPLCVFSEILKVVQVQELLDVYSTHIDLRVIGPSDSDVFRKIVREVQDKPHEVYSLLEKYLGKCCVNGNCERVELEKAKLKGHLKSRLLALKPGGALKMYSSLATVTAGFAMFDYAGISGGAGIRNAHAWDRVGQGDKLLEMVNIDLARTTADEKKLLRGLVEELGRRGVVGEEGMTNVAIVSEWDTAYGRAIPEVFREEYGGGDRKESQGGERGVKVYSYLRGIDGEEIYAKRGGQKGVSGSSESKKKSDGEKLDEYVAGLEAPFGGHQLDYMRRLAERIRVDDARLRREGKGGFKAIGVLGSDVYDKLLIMRALRPAFRNLIFFTTDLDSRLWDTRDLEWTRNMVVASGYGLRVRDALQGDIPPFRDGYQTSTYCAALAALGMFKCGWPGSGAPRIFEIGRNGPVDLTPYADTPAGGLIQPEREDKRGLWDLTLMGTRWSILLAMLFLLVLPIVLCLGKKKVSGGVSVQTKKLGVFGLLLFVLFWMLVWWDLCDGAGEPWSLKSGVSIWPTELIRLGAFFSGVCLICLMFHEIRESDRQLGVGSGQDPERGDSTAQNEEKRVKFFQRIKNLLVGLKKACRDVTSRRGWRRWCRRCFIPLAKDFVSAPFIVRKDTCVETWSVCGRARKKGVGDERLSFEGEVLLEEYLDRGTIEARRRRTFRMVIFYSILSVFIFLVDRFPSSPYRGDLSWLADKCILFLSLFALFLLMFFVIDAMMLCRRFILNLSRHKTIWPEKYVKNQIDAEAVDTVYFDDVVDIRIIARRTKAIGRMVMYPFVPILLMLLARDRHLDNWTWQAGLIFVIVLGCVLTLWSGMSLRRAAERARRRALERLEDLKMKCMAKLIELRGQVYESEVKSKGKARKAGVGKLNGDEGLEKVRLEQVDHAISYVKGIRDGAFGPLGENPVLAAVLIPFGGLGVANVIDAAVGML